MPMEFLLTSLLRDKQRRDQDIARQDQLLARETARDQRNFDAQQDHRRFLEGVDRRRLAMAEDAQRKSDAQRDFQNRLSLLGLQSQGALEPSVDGGDPSRFSGTLDFDGQTFGVVKPDVLFREREGVKSELAQKAFDTETANMVARTNQAVEKINVPAGRELGGFNANTGSAQFVSPPRPVTGPQPPAALQTLQHEGEATSLLYGISPAAQEFARKTGGRAVSNVPSDLTQLGDGDLHRIAQMQAAQAPASRREVLQQLMFRQLRTARDAQLRRKGGGGGEEDPLLDFLRNRQGGSNGAAPIIKD